MGIYLLILFIIIPIIEIYLFILIGSEIGIISTLLVVILTAVVGTYLLRIQGLVTLQKAQRMMEQGQMPAEALIEGIHVVDVVDSSLDIIIPLESNE